MRGSASELERIRDEIVYSAAKDESRVIEDTDMAIAQQRWKYDELWKRARGIVDQLQGAEERSRNLSEELHDSRELFSSEITKLIHQNEMFQRDLYAQQKLSVQLQEERDLLLTEQKSSVRETQMLEDKLQTTEKDLTEQKEKYSRLRSEFDVMIADKEVLEQEVPRLRGRLDETERELEHVVESYQRCDKERETAVAQKQSIMHTVQRMENSLAESRRLNDELLREADNQKHEFAKELNDARNRLEGAMKDRQSVSSEMADALHVIKKMELENARVRESHETETRKARSMINELMDKMSQLERENGDLASKDEYRREELVRAHASAIRESQGERDKEMQSLRDEVVLLKERLSHSEAEGKRVHNLARKLVDDLRLAQSEKDHLKLRLSQADIDTLQRSFGEMERDRVRHERSKSPFADDTPFSGRWTSGGDTTARSSSRLRETSLDRSAFRTSISPTRRGISPSLSRRLSPPPSARNLTRF